MTFEHSLTTETTSSIAITLTKIIESVFEFVPASQDDQIFQARSFSSESVKAFQEVIQRTFGRTLSLGTLFQASSVASLAAILSEPLPNEAWTSIVPFQLAGKLPPFFCVHGAGGDVLRFRTLASLLGPSRPFYGLQPAQADGPPDHHPTVEGIASDYIQSIRTVQSRGPYYLGGYSFGGVIAFEMAQQLLHMGEEVALLVLIDTQFPGGQYSLPGAHNPRFINRLDYAVGKFFSITHKQRISWLKEIISRNVRRVGVLRSTPADRLNTAHIAAHVSYKPRVLSSRIVLLWASDCAFRAFEDSRPVWSEVAGLGLEIRRVTGDHLSLLTPPYVHVVAHELRSCLMGDGRRSTTKPMTDAQDLSETATALAVVSSRLTQALASIPEAHW